MSGLTLTMDFAGPTVRSYAPSPDDAFPRAAAEREQKLKAARVTLGGVDYQPDPRLCHHGQRSGECCSCKPWC